MNAIVQLDHVGREYAGNVHALREVSLTINYGEFVAIVGPSGSGKSTMLQVIGTLARPTTGTVHVDGHEVASLSDRQLSALRARRIGFVFQQFHLAPGVTALDNVADGMLYQGIPLAKRRERAEEALNLVGLTHRLDHLPNELSGGECQRVAVARAIAGEPPLLLADEPTGNLDTASGSEVMAILHTLHRSGTTVLVITHDRDIAASLPRRVALLDGQVQS
jgi:putative ABC transport system ATP-binding protein